MQPNDITLNVDILNDGNTTPVPYERYEVFLNRSSYVATNHTLEARDKMDLYRSFPTKNGNFKGVSKTAFKLTKDFDVSGADGVATLTSPCIVEVSFSVPVGVPAADVKEMRQRALAMLDSDPVMDDLNIQLQV